jgi:hypothetical protein
MVTTLGVTKMSTDTKPHTISELVNEIYEDNYSHFEFEENMGGEPCDCHLHITMNTIVKYWGE